MVALREALTIHHITVRHTMHIPYDKTYAFFPDNNHGDPTTFGFYNHSKTIKKLKKKKQVAGDPKTLSKRDYRTSGSKGKMKVTRTDGPSITISGVIRKIHRRT
jgi:hypothetical protein